MLNPNNIESIEGVKLKIYQVAWLRNCHTLILTYYKNSRKLVNATGIKNYVEISQLSRKIENIFGVYVSKVKIDSIFLR